jgi:hypothetical protein
MRSELEIRNAVGNLERDQRALEDRQRFEKLAGMHAARLESVKARLEELRWALGDIEL